ncbi:MAG: dihydroorotase [Spirosomaceae bacterium]|nr:dihydroorotase [Spirosomataceae bacterium]
MPTLLILNARIVNEGTITEKDVFVRDGFIDKIAGDLSHLTADKIIDGTGKFLLPGVIDDQVHFREPGLTHKGNLYTEPKAAVAGGTTSFMEMPNTVPNALTQELLQDKYDIAAKSSLANYSFFMGTSNDNYDEVMRTDVKNICGLKIFMGSSTGNMLVDDEATLSKIFANFPALIATHCEDEATVRARNEKYMEMYGDAKTEDIPYDIHALIRNEEGCYKSSSFAVELAKRHDTRLHILHLSSSEELSLFRNDIPLAEKRITAEVCVHHLWFDAEDYKRLGTKIKCNPAIKHNHRENLFAAMLDNRLDIIATDHAPHTVAEKDPNYWKAHAGLPLVQHSLLAMLDFAKQGKISMERVVEKMSHAPAICFQINRRGFIREGYYADLTLVDLMQETTVTKENILFKCGWSPFEGHAFPAAVTHTIVSGHLAYENGVFNESKQGERMTFDRG